MSGTTVTGTGSSLARKGKRVVRVRETASPLHGLTAVSYLMKPHALRLRWAILDATEAMPLESHCVLPRLPRNNQELVDASDLVLLRNQTNGSGEMAQSLRAQTAPLEDPGLVPRTHVVARNCP